jgi:hypothetical protein
MIFTRNMPILVMSDRLVEVDDQTNLDALSHICVGPITQLPQEISCE